MKFVDNGDKINNLSGVPFNIIKEMVREWGTIERKNSTFRKSGEKFRESEMGTRGRTLLLNLLNSLISECYRHFESDSRDLDELLNYSDFLETLTFCRNESGLLMSATWTLSLAAALLDIFFMLNFFVIPLLFSDNF